jgi:hypothetical protein
MAAEQILRGVPKTVRTLYDKSSWGPGPWQDEPDDVRWSDSVTGIRCMLWRASGVGRWCGHCSLPGGHPWERLRAEDIPVSTVGHAITSKGVVNGDGGGLIWIGFECDGLKPAVKVPARAHWLPYRDQRYATGKVLRLTVDICLATGPGAWWEGGHG